MRPKPKCLQRLIRLLRACRGRRRPSALLRQRDRHPGCALTRPCRGSAAPRQQESNPTCTLAKGAEHREQRTTALLHAQKAVAPLSCLSPGPNECDAKAIPQRRNSGRHCLKLGRWRAMNREGMGAARAAQCLPTPRRRS